MSSTCCAPPHISAASATVARAMTCDNGLPPPRRGAEKCASRQRDIVEPDLAQLPGVVDRRQYCEGEPGGIPRHQEQADAILHCAAVAGARRNHENVGEMRIADK